MRIDKKIVPYGTLEKTFGCLMVAEGFYLESNYGDNGYIWLSLSEEGQRLRAQVPFSLDIRLPGVHETYHPQYHHTWGYRL